MKGRESEWPGRPVMLLRLGLELNGKGGGRGKGV